MYNYMVALYTSIYMVWYTVCLASVRVHLLAHLIYDVLTVEVPEGVRGVAQ